MGPVSDVPYSSQKRVDQSHVNVEPDNNDVYFFSGFLDESFVSFVGLIESFHDHDVYRIRARIHTPSSQ